jgi:hypothetical protein
MIARVSITFGALAALLMAGQAAMAGGMPSNEGPEVELDGAELQKFFTATISTFTEEDLSQYVEASSSADSVTDLNVEVSLPPAALSKAEQYGVRPGGRDDRGITP